MADPRAGPRGELSRWQVAWRVLTFVFSKEVDTFVKRKEGTKVTRTGGRGLKRGVEAKGGSYETWIRSSRRYNALLFNVGKSI